MIMNLQIQLNNRFNIQVKVNLLIKVILMYYKS